eukprot:scaffold33523_cov112-Isochrysis_galbana.AAC.4
MRRSGPHALHVFYIKRDVACVHQGDEKRFATSLRKTERHIIDVQQPNWHGRELLLRHAGKSEKPRMRTHHQAVGAH